MKLPELQRVLAASDSFQHYLASKKTIDDRAINRVVWERLQQSLAARQADQATTVLEIGAGIGTMIERIIEWELLLSAEITAIDSSVENIAHAHRRLVSWGSAHGLKIQEHSQNDLIFTKPGVRYAVHLKTIDIFDFQPAPNSPTWDLVVAHAFLDLLDLSTAIKHIFSLIKPGGLFYFTLNFDAVSIFEPAIDPEFDAIVMALYHQSMDQRLVNGVPSGESKTGRHLFKTLQSLGGEILEAGASDWVIYPHSGRYIDEEAFFLHFLIHTIERQLSQSSDLDQTTFASWIAKRHEQIEQGELIFIAHQLDFVGNTPSEISVGKSMRHSDK